MKKFLSVMLTLIMSLSIATVFVACEDQVEPQTPTHTHTYATEWTSDDTHHWHKATCEHTDEISDKAEHSFGEDKKCTVCQKEKPATGDDSAYKVTAEQWSTKFNALSNMTNVKIVGISTGDIESSTVIEIDENKIYYSVYVGEVFSEAAVIVKVNESAFDVYKQTTENGQYVKLQDNDDIEDVLDFIEGYSLQYISANNFAKDKFDGAVYNGSTKDYTLAMDSAELPDFITVSNLEYIVSFENAEIKDLSIKYGVVLNQTVNHSFDFEFGGIEVTVPTNFTEQGSQGEGEGNSPYKVTSEQWTTKFNALTNMSNGKISCYSTDGETEMLLLIEVEGNKTSFIAYTNEVFQRAGAFVKINENTYNYYTKATENGEYAPSIDEEGTIEYIAVQLEQYKIMAQYAKDNYADATYAETTKDYSLTLGTQTISSLPITVNNLSYKVAFMNGELKTEKVTYYVPMHGASYTLDFEFGGVTVNVPQV